MKLYDLPRESKIFFPEGDISDGSTYIIFHHLDGMYSYCTTEKGGVMHLSVMTNLRKTKGGYKVIYPTNEK